MSEIGLKQLKSDTPERRLEKLQNIKFQIIGNSEKKEFYFQQGLIEVLFPMIGGEKEEKMLMEIITIINSYFFDFPKAQECFKFFSHTLVQLHFFLQTFKDSKGPIIDMVLRILKNALTSGIIQAADLENQSLIEEFMPLMNSKVRISLISKLLSLIVQRPHFKDHVTQNPQIMTKILDMVTNHSLLISDECLENCLSAMAEIVQKSKVNSQIVHEHINALLNISEFFRHPNNIIKIKSARIITSVKKYYKLPKLVKRELRWILMQMINLLHQVKDKRLLTQICLVIKDLTEEGKGSKLLQKTAGDVQAIEKLSELFVEQSYQSLKQFPDHIDLELNQQYLVALLKALAALTSQEESCRKKVSENKKALEEILKIIKSPLSNNKKAACLLFVSLSRSDKMVKSIILEAGEFTKELQRIMLESDKNEKLQLLACKSLCNLALDFQKNLANDSSFMCKLVDLTQSTNLDLKIAACFTIKNLLFKNQKDVRSAVLKEFQFDRLNELMEDENIRVQEQALMICRNLLYQTENEIQQVLDSGGDSLLEKLERNLNSSFQSIVIQTLYILCSIAGGNQKQKKTASEDRFFHKALQLLKSTDSSNIKIGVLNLLINLAFQGSEQKDGKIRKYLQSLNLPDMLTTLREVERDPEVRGFIDRAIKHLS